MSDTPRTDRVLKNCNGWHHVPIEMARELEHELKEMELIASVRLSYIKQLESEKEAFITRIKQLEEAGDRLLTVMRGEEDCAYCEWIALAHEADLKWHKAKKAKP